MPLNTISNLETALISWTNAGISSAQAQDLLTLGEDRIYRELRVRQMEESTSVTITSGVVPLPTSYIELRNAQIDGSPDRALQRKEADWIYQKYPQRSSSGKPSFIAREGNNFIFGPYPDSEYVVNLKFYKRPATAVGSTLSGVLLSSPGLLLFASLAESAPFLGQDPRIATWENRYQQLKELVMKEDKTERLSGSPLAVTPG